MPYGHARRKRVKEIKTAMLSKFTMTGNQSFFCFKIIVEYLQFSAKVQFNNFSCFHNRLMNIYYVYMLKMYENLIMIISFQIHSNLLQHPLLLMHNSCF